MKRLLLLWSLIYLSQFPANSQLLVSSGDYSPDLDYGKEETTFLADILSGLEQKYNVSIIYNSDLIGNISVHSNGQYPGTSLEEHLKTYLTPHGLQYKKLEDSFYVIRKTDAERTTPDLIKAKMTYSNQPGEPMFASIKHRDTFVLNTTKKASIAPIDGEVTDGDSGEGLPGVSIVIKGTSTGTITNADGQFNIEANQGDVLIFSYVGYKTSEVTVGTSNNISVSMTPDVTALSEIVVVGYGTQQRRDITGSIASISAKQIKDIPVVSFENAIQGQLAGVQVSETSGEPGAGPSIRVRGIGSISAGNEPLYVIDGFPVSKNVDAGVQGDIFRRRAAFRPPPSNPLATLNPNDIESIEVLKDASAAAIYGSRGSNGVILITTKKGKREGKPQVSFDTYWGVQSVANKIDLMNADQLTDYVIDSRNNAYLQNETGASADHSNAERNATAIANGGAPNANYRIADDFINRTGTDTDWQDLIFDNAAIQSYNVSVSGGSDNVGYYVAGGYHNQEGIIDGSGFDRYSFRVNLEADVLPELKVGFNLNPSFTVYDRLPAGSPYFARPAGIVYSALVHSPTIDPFNPDGTINQRDNAGFLFTEDGEGSGITSASNPLAVIEAIQDDLNQNRTFGNVWGEYELIDGLKFKSFAGFDINNYERTFFRANSLLHRTSPVGEPFGQSSSSQSVNWLAEQTLSYSKSSADHNISAVAGFTAQKETIEISQVIADNFFDDRVPTINGGQVTEGSASREEWSLVSLLARGNYSYRDKYLLTATIRTDRSSRFGKGNRTGVFPSVSGGWRLSEESFMSDFTLLSDLKIRASWGQTGNFLIPNFASIGLLNPAGYVFGTNRANGLGPSTLSNPDLSWEKTSQVDIGLEFGFFNDRVFTSIDWYKSTTSDLLLQIQIPSANGFANSLQNLGEVENKGIEISLSTRNLTGPLTWTTDFNFSSINNKVTKVGPTGDPILSAGGAGNRHITRIGDAIGSYYGYVVDGIYQSQADIDAAPTDTQAPDARPGDFRFKDVDGDGDIDPDDRTVTGNYLPDFTWGITNRFSFKGFDLNILIQGVEGAEVLNLTRRHLGNGEANFNSYAAWDNRWRSASDPGNGKIPRADRLTGNHGNNNRPSSFQVEDASYIRLRNITLGYNLPNDMLGKVFQNLRIYVSGTNLLTSTDYLGFNPEVNNQSAASPNVQGEDYGAYPLSKVFTLGLNATF